MNRLDCETIAWVHAFHAFFCRFCFCISLLLSLDFRRSFLMIRRRMQKPPFCVLCSRPLHSLVCGSIQSLSATKPGIDIGVGNRVKDPNSQPLKLIKVEATLMILATSRPLRTVHFMVLTKVLKSPPSATSSPSPPPT